MAVPPQWSRVASNYLNTPWKQWLLAGLWALFLLIISLIPSSAIPKIDWWAELISPDKLVHALVYGVFAVLLYLPLRSWRINGGFTAFLLASAFGAAMEGLQLVTNTGRSYDLADMLANLVGAALAMGLCYFVSQKEIES